MDFSVILGNLGNTCDRFLSSGYKDQPSKEEMLKQAAEINGVKGIELVGVWDVAKENVNKMKDSLDKYGLKCVSIIPDLFSQRRWGKGSFCSKDPLIRKQAIEEIIVTVEIAERLDCTLINIWCGQDGYDYPLQADFIKEREWLKDGFTEICKSFPKIRFALEYKMKEPRNRSYMARCADTLLLAKEIGTDNVGVTIDVGHSLMAYENVAEAVVMLKIYGDKLFHMHFNDNYRYWDDDMVVGSIHLSEYVELLFWLKEIGYKGWYSMDQYPYRENAQSALRESIEFLMGIDKMLDESGMREIRGLVNKGDAAESCAWLRKKIFT